MSPLEERAETKLSRRSYRTKAESYIRIRQAIADGANSVDEIAKLVGLSPFTVVTYASENNINLPLSQGRFIKRTERIDAIVRALAECVNSQEQFLAQTGFVSGSSLARFCLKEGIELPANLTFGYRPEMDAQIQKGATLEEIGAAAGVQRERARQYLHATNQYQLRLQRIAERKQRLIELTNVLQAPIQNLVTSLEARVQQLARTASWAEQKALEYIKSVRFTHYTKEQLIGVFKLYETAKNQDQMLSLDELGKPFDIHAPSVGRIFRIVGVPSLYWNVKERHFYDIERIKTGLEICRLGMSPYDAAFFVDIPDYILVDYIIREREVRTSRLSYTRVSFKTRGSSIVTYRLSSQVYKALDAGITSIDDIAKLLDKRPEVVQRAVELRNQMEPLIIQALRICYNDSTYNVSYKKSA